MARPPYEPTNADRETVKKLASLGIRHDDIARFIHVAPKTLRKHFRAELLEIANFKIKVEAHAHQRVFKNDRFLEFYLRTRQGWHETAAFPTDRRFEFAFRETAPGERIAHETEDKSLIVVKK